jgi:predicted nucleotide-binding protein
MREIMVELPELDEDQRLFLKTIFNYFHKEGKWPTYLWVENTIRKTYPARWPNFDIVKVCKSLPDGFASGFGFNRNYEQEAGFIAPALYYFPEAKEEMADFIRVVRFCVDKINASDELRPEISSEDLSSQLHMQPLAIRKMYLLLQWEPNIMDGSGANEEWWRINLQRGIDGVRRFEGIETFEQYLEKRTALTRMFSGNIAAWPVQIKLVSRKVFIVHGHDTEARETVARFIEKLGLEPIILDEQPSEGKTIIEKFETHSDVHFAVVLMTPDDLGTSKDKPQDLKPRARQNVILELGYFVAKLGRGRVCCLNKGGLEIPSDYYGVVYIPMDTGEWRFQLAKEMKQVIKDIDLNKLVD